MLRAVGLGSTAKTSSFLSSLLRGDLYNDLDRYGRMGVDALATATPIDSGETAQSWDYKIRRTATKTTLVWTNSHVNDGAPIAILLQYGHATGTGGYVQGYDYINPAIRPIMNQIAEDVWRRVTRG